MPSAAKWNLLPANDESFNNGSGIANGAATKSNIYCFRAYHNTTQAITTAGATVAFNTESYDYGNNFASNTYTAPVAGAYHFDAQTAWSATGSQTRCVLILSINGSGGSGIVIGDVSTGAAAFGINGSTDVQLALSDTVAIFFLPVGATTTLRAGGANTASTWFSGHLVHAT